MKLEIVKYPDPLLTKTSLPVERFDSDLGRLLDDMAETMYSANGIGLAAIQVGKDLRTFVLDIGLADESCKRLFEFVNPVLKQGSGKIVYEEGCLSVPGVTEEVRRKANIFVEYQDRNGNFKELHAEGLLAVAIQHENDHLDGIVFVERLSPLKRRLIKRKLLKRVTQ